MSSKINQEIVNDTAKLIMHRLIARAIVHRFLVDDRIVTAVAPAPDDPIVSKLARLAPRTKLSLKQFMPSDRSIRIVSNG